jgi:hypothetical protein
LKAKHFHQVPNLPLNKPLSGILLPFLMSVGGVLLEQECLDQRVFDEELDKHDQETIGKLRACRES